MTLERWSVHRYRAPRLDVRAIQRRDDALTVDSKRGMLTLTCNDARRIDGELLPALEALRDEKSDVWTAVLNGTQADLLLLIRDLDVLGLIRDANPAVAATGEIETMVADWSAALGRDLATRGDAAVKTVQELVERLAADPPEPRTTTLEDARFPVVTLLLQARYLRRDAPAVFAALVEGLRGTVRVARGQQARGIRIRNDGSVVDAATVRQYLATASALVRDLFEPDVLRRARPQRATTAPVSGINFILDLEHEVARMLLELGESPAIVAAQDPS